MLKKVAAKPIRPPVRRSAAIEDEAIDRLAKGETLRQICRDDHMPDAGSIVKWCEADQSFAQRYAHARSKGLDVMAEQTLDIADDLSEDANSRRVRVDTRKWLLSKLRPGVYGDRSSIELSGANGGPIQHVVRDEQLAALDEADLLLLQAVKRKMIGGAS